MSCSGCLVFLSLSVQDVLYSDWALFKLIHWRDIVELVVSLLDWDASILGGFVCFVKGKCLCCLERFEDGLCLHVFAVVIAWIYTITSCNIFEGLETLSTYGFVHHISWIYLRAYSHLLLITCSELWENRRSTSNANLTELYLLVRVKNAHLCDLMVSRPKFSTLRFSIRCLFATDARSNLAFPWIPRCYPPTLTFTWQQKKFIIFISLAPSFVNGAHFDRIWRPRSLVRLGGLLAWELGLVDRNRDVGCVVYHCLMHFTLSPGHITETALDLAIL